MTRRAALAALAALLGLLPRSARAQIDFTPPHPAASCADPLAMTEKELVQMGFLNALVGWAARHEHVLTAWVMVDPQYPWLVPAKHLLRLAGVSFRVQASPGPLPGGKTFAMLANCGELL